MEQLFKGGGMGNVGVSVQGNWKGGRGFTPTPYIPPPQVNAGAIKGGRVVGTPRCLTCFTKGLDHRHHFLNCPVNKQEWNRMLEHEGNK